MSSSSFFIFNNEKVQIDFEIYEKLPLEIKKEIFHKGEYYIQAPVSRSILDSFFEYIKDNNNKPTINISNIEDYILLNNELIVMSDYINEFKFVDISKISLCCKENIDTSVTEKEIAQNLDYFLNNYSEEMYNISIPKLLNIMNHKEKVLKNHNKAYEFIKHGLENNTNFCIFFDLIDFMDLSKEHINDFISNKNKYFGLTPKLNVSLYESINQKLEEIKFQQEQTLNKMIQNENNQYNKNIIVYDIEVPLNDKMTINIPLFTNVIHDDLFKFNQKLVSVQLPPSVISIGDKAFMNLKSLKHIKLSPFLHYIGNDAFNGCILLEQIEFTQFLINIDANAFAGCESLKQLHLPSSLTALGSSAFSNCTGLENVELSSSLTIITADLFNGCSLLKHIIIPTSVSNIGSRAFANCKSLEKIIIPNSVKSFDICVFEGCTSLIEVNIPESLNLINYGTFKRCSSLTKINIPSSVTQILGSSFEKCSKLEEIVIPNSVTLIGYRSFFECTSLKQIEIPRSVVKIEQSAFENCSLTARVPQSSIQIEQKAFYNPNGQIQRVNY